VLEFVEQYTAAFQEYLAAGDETCLQRAYELGHDAMVRGLRILDVAGAHSHAVATGLPSVSSPEEGARLVTAAADFLMESLSPYEMTHQGFLEANATLRRLNQELQQRVLEIQEADRRKDEFLSMLAHELRNPLAAVSNAVRVLRSADATGSTWQRALDILERQVGHQTRLVDELLEVSRITRGRIQLHLERLDLAHVAQESSEDHRSAATERGLRLTVSVPRAPVWVAGDPIRLAQVLGNLLQNSIKFTDPGGEIAVEVGVEVDGGWAVLTVRDTGIGIEAELLPRVFDTFTQTDHSLQRSAGGLGLGLPLVKGLVDLHGGTVSAHSEGLGRGAEFVVRLALESRTAVAESASTTGSAHPPAASLRILVVEDIRDAAESLRDLLELWGHVVEVAETGSTALAAARQFRPDVVLCDIGLPGMDGYAVAVALRQDPATASVRLLALSGYGQEEDQRRSRHAGFDCHLTKPVDFAKLEGLLGATPGTRAS
jgi:signal transduction histidine kinase/ActR/RegA family two-component response regulator